MSRSYVFLACAYHNSPGPGLELLAWFALNMWLFLRTFLLYYHGPQYYYLHRMLGLGLCISRASASVLNLNCSVILLPMCRILLAFLRGSQKVASRKMRRLLDKSKTFHVMCGVTICIFSVVHVAAHLVNVLNFSQNYTEDFLSLNAANYRDEDPRKLLFTTVPGLTGVLLVLVLFLMFTASTYAIRASNYNIFWYTHNLFFVFYLLLIIHVSGGVLKYQINIQQHPPGCFNPNKTLQETIPEPKVFEESFPEYATQPFPEGLAETDSFVQTKFERICTEEPKFQSHYPECPTDTKATFGVHIKIVGDWTERFRDLLLPHWSQDTEILPIFHQRHYPKLFVDGPFGSPSEESLNYEVSLCVAGGIGVTPFASVLNTLLDDWKCYKLRRLYFIWVCRDIQAFCWFANLLCVLHNKLWQENRPDFINIQLYLSQTDGIQKIIGEKYQALNSRLLIGRPRWKLLFDEIAKCNRQKTVGVFCCGPKEISKTLHKLSNRHNSYGTRFEYNKESFS
ncbi:NADPH oxidase 4 isoform X7 [Alligator mississippiensis]|uniref:NADPH oxidase 4 isoform X7 n=1 Tax=Alligator mississippiensis TaxID=8496 RepID=UPI0028778C79|nr:NADPH oxidase 4 isoform X7 [Alligator mississippiensis]